MITKSDWSEWKQHKITRKLMEVVIEAGKTGAIEELVRNRKSVGDFQRGAIAAYEDIIQNILSGEYLVEVEDE